MGLMTWLKSLGGFIGKMFKAAIENGVTDPLAKLAVSYAKTAATKFVDNAQRREWVVAQLMSRGVPESLARVLTELAVQFIKKEIEKVGTVPQA